MVSKEELKNKIDFLEKHCRENKEVYLMKCKNIYKIGVSWDAYSRRKYLQEIIPFPIKIIYHGEPRDAYKLEHQLHRYFKDKNYNGEWFNLNKDDVTFVIEAIKNEEKLQRELYTTQ
jgi:hypothetical protein